MSEKSIAIKKEKRTAITYIIYELLKGNKLSTKDMAELVVKNQRTCQRYVKELEDSDLPIRCDGIRYYLNTDDGYLPFYLPKEKINMIYLSLISFSAFGIDLKLINDILIQIEELISPSDKTLLDSIKENLVVKRRCEIISADSYSSYQIFMLLAEALSYKRSVRIKYKAKKNHDYRVIDVYGFCLAKETYYINAYCHKFNTVLIFRIDRITECSIEEMYYQVSKDFNLKNYYKYTWEVENSREPFDFEILFSGRAIYNVTERKWCENQNIVKNGDSLIIFSGTTSSEMEFIKWILGFGSEAKVLSPIWLKDIVKVELNKAMLLYD